MANSSNNYEALPSAPVLILDLLSAHGKPLSVQALCRSGALLGIAESAIRVGLTRLAREHKIVRSGRGMYAYQRDALGQVLDDWQSQDRRTIDWNGHWIAVYGANVPRGEKTIWRHHSLALALRGFVEFQAGLHIRPDNLSAGMEDFHAELLSLGLSPDALVYRMVDLGPQQQLAACALWDTRSREAEYRRWIARLEKSRQALRGMQQEQALRESLLQGRAAIAFLIRDPLLPPQLMPSAPRQGLVDVVIQYKKTGHKLWQAWIAEMEA
jgi:phenylacetic acid degradation operon negative regulatory protein